MTGWSTGASCYSSKYLCELKWIEWYSHLSPVEPLFPPILDIKGWNKSIAKREGVHRKVWQILASLVSSTDEFCCSYIILSGLSTALGTRKMPQRVTLSGSLTSSWRDWPPKEEWPEVATSGQLPASRVLLSAVLPNSLLINLCCLA